MCKNIGTAIFTPQNGINFALESEENGKDAYERTFSYSGLVCRKY